MSDQDRLTMITEREQELQPLYDRMDKDKGLLWGDFKMLGLLGEKKGKVLEDVINITRNRPGVFAQAIIAILYQACLSKQIQVEGLTDTAQSLLEHFVDDANYTANQIMMKRFRTNLEAHLCGQLAVRGWGGVLITYGEKDHKPHYRRLDMRFTPFQDDDSEEGGLIWVAPHYKRTGASIIKEYGTISGIEDSAKTKYDLYDFWNDDTNEIYVNKQLVRETKNPYGFVNFIIGCPISQYYLDEEDSIAHQGESVFQFIRQEIDASNRLATIEHTKAYEYLSPSYTHEDTSQGKYDTPDGRQPNPPKIDANMAVVPGETPTPLDKPDLSRFFASAIATVSQDIQQGSLSDAELGDADVNRTAIWITKQQEIRKKVLYPLISTLQTMLARVAEMTVEEWRVHAFPNPPLLGKAGNTRKYVVSELPEKDTYTLEYILTPTSAEEQMASYAVGLSLKGELSRETRLRDIYKLKDPDEELDKLATEEARQSNPVLFFMDLAERLLDQAERKTGDDAKSLKRKAQVMADMMVDAIRKMKMSQVPEQGTKNLQLENGNTQSMLALPGLMGNPRGGGGRKALPAPQQEAVNAGT